MTNNQSQEIQISYIPNQTFPYLPTARHPYYDTNDKSSATINILNQDGDVIAQGNENQFFSLKNACEEVSPLSHKQQSMNTVCTFILDYTDMYTEPEFAHTKLYREGNYFQRLLDSINVIEQDLPFTLTLKQPGNEVLTINSQGTPIPEITKSQQSIRPIHCWIKRLQQLRDTIATL